MRLFMIRGKSQAAVATVIALAAVATFAYFVTRDGEESAVESEPAGRIETPAPSPLVSTPQSSPGSTTGTEGEQVEGGSGNPITSSASPATTQSLCPFLPSGTDPGSPQDLAKKTADVAIDSIPVLSVFAAAMHASGYDAVLRKATGVTILAPTDDAFAADIPEDELEKLLIQRHRNLKSLLETHVIGKRRPLGTLVDAGRGTALSGDVVTFAATGQVVRVSDDANVTCSDLGAANATIHIIDSVLGYIQLTEPQEELG
jgi:uncharacterized surface protein with fasciclin (FAS1) repeats